MTDAETEFEDAELEEEIQACAGDPDCEPVEGLGNPPDWEPEEGYLERPDEDAEVPE